MPIFNVPSRLFALIWCACFVIPASNLPADEAVPLHGNTGFETDQDGDAWPDGWARVNGGSWQLENGNRFVRLESPSAGSMVMLYQEIAIPAGTEAISLAWRQRVSNLRVGKNAWFDARIMLECLDTDRKKVTPTPPAPSTRTDTDDWVDRSTAFLVPAGAKTLKFMPCLFQVTSGTFDLDDIVITSIDPNPLRAAADEAIARRLASLDAEIKKRQKKAAAQFAAEASLITNGDFEHDDKTRGWPDAWGRPASGSWEEEDGNHFLRLSTSKPDVLNMVYRVIDLPAGTQAVELTWRQRVTGLVRGTSPWFDARILLDLLGPDGKKLKQPSPSYTQKDTDGWVTRKTAFLVPDHAVAVALMPSLFQVKAGTFDLDDLVLRPIAPEPLEALALQREAEAKARHVPPETPQRERWPSPIHVVGNRLHDPNGREVWLQGVNAGGLETLPADIQVLKSIVVAIDNWKANCVRVPMNETFWFGRSSYQQDGGKQYREILDQAITLAANRGSYVVIDLHRFRAPKEEHADFWRDFASRYKDHPAVLFDLFNEPHGISWDVWQHGGFVGTREGTDESGFLKEDDKKRNEGFESIGMQKLVDAVRSTGAKNIVIAGGVFWCNDLSGITKGHTLQDQLGNGIMYSWHTYNWHTDWEEKLLATAALHPIFVGEVGADITKMSFIPEADQEDPFTWVPDMLGFIQKHRLNWTGWCLHPKASPIMISDWNYTPTPFWGTFAKRALAGESFELKRTR